jgi:hypothetical protein
MSILQKELETYFKALPELQAKYPNGGTVVIKDDKILGVWNDRLDALRAGIEAHGNVQFLVKSLNDAEEVITYSRDMLFA